MRYLFVFVFFFFSACRLSSNNEKQASISTTLQKVDIEGNGFVIDEIGILNKEQITELSSTLKEYYNISGVEILCIITSSFKEFGSEQNYTDYFLYNYDREASKNLVLVILFSEDRRVFIRTNKHSEQYYLPDKCEDIINSYMLPNFKKGDFFEGFKLGINELVL